ncbi:MAG: 3-deoxy-D-manno-octulosonic acid transferase [Marinibacterium sp.]
MPTPGASPAPVPAPTSLFRLYSSLTALAEPLVFAHVARKLRAQSVAPARIGERRGIATLPRPEGQLVWFHGASVGESLSALTLISRLGARLPRARFLLTSGTASSADIVAARLPARTSHQFAPLDSPAIARRFLDHWRPDAGVFVESELWPGLLMRARARGTRLALVNARLSARSAAAWAKRPATARMVLDCFDILLTQNAETARRLTDMGADPTRLTTGANLKAGADPLPVDDAALAGLSDTLGTRPLWAASSTHPGEDEIVLTAHHAVLDTHPDAVLLLIPRHPDRGAAVDAMARANGLITARRSSGAAPDADCQVYIADTLGETGTWYALAPIVLLGGSLVPGIGGHNPFEPARAGAAILTGAHTHNFPETFSPMIAARAATGVKTATDIAGTVTHWLTAPAALETARQTARAFAIDQAGALDGVIDRLIDTLRLAD